MNKKLIAAAVSAVVMAPVAAQADVSVYGRIHNGIDLKSESGYSTTTGTGSSAVTVKTPSKSTTDISGISSRFGIKASSDLGNGLTASARYEFAITTDKEHGNAISTKSNDLRLGTVSISGGFGSVTIGNQWSAFYDIVGTHIDPTFAVGYYLYSSFTGGPYRASNTIKYANSFGPISLELDVRMNESDEGSAVAEKINGDGLGIGLSFAATDSLTFAVAIDSEDGATDDTDRTGVAAKFSGGGYWAALGWHENEVGSASTDHTQLWVGKSLGDNTSVMFGLGNADNGTAEPSAVAIGVYHNMGGGFKLMYEGTSYDADNAISGKGDFNRHVFSMRLDF